MRTTFSNSDRRSVFTLAWQFVKTCGMNLSEALRLAWRNIKLRKAMHERIIKFTFLKIDGSVRQAFGTLSENIVPATAGTDRRRNDTVQVYYDTEKQAWRCFKKANLLTATLF